MWSNLGFDAGKWGECILIMEQYIILCKNSVEMFVTIRSCLLFGEPEVKNKLTSLCSIMN